MHVSIHRRCAARTVYIYYCLLVSLTLLVVGSRGVSSSCLSPAKTYTVGFCPLLLIFTRYISTPWRFAFTGFSAISYMDIHLRTMIRSWGSFWGSMSPTSLEGVPKWSGTLRRIFSHWKFPHNLLRFSFCLIFSDFSAIVVRFLFSSALAWRVFPGSCLSQKVSCFLEAPNFSEGMLRVQEWCPGD